MHKNYVYDLWPPWLDLTPHLHGKPAPKAVVASALSSGRLGGNADVDGRTEGGRRGERAVIKEKCMKAAGGGGVG